MIVRDEARCLARCLQSVKGADQIVVIDTGSIDGTAEIARSLGAEVGYFAWQADFARARNVSLERARCDWILVLDADETLPEGGLEVLRQEATGVHEGYIVPVDSVVEAKGERMQHTTMALRFFRNRPEHRYEGRIHEQTSRSILARGGTIGQSRVRLVHDGYDPAIIGNRSKHERNLEILLAMADDDPRSPYPRYKLGSTLAVLDRPEEAKAQLEAALALVEGAEDPRAFPFHRDVYITLARLAGRDGDVTATLEILHRAASALPDSPEIQFELGRWHSTWGDRDEAIAYLAAALELAESGGQAASDPVEVGWQAGLLAGDLAAAGGRQAGSLGYYERATRIASRLPCAARPSAPWLRAAATYLQEHRIQEALQAYREVLSVQPSSLPALLGLGTLYFEQGDFKSAAGCLQVALELKPGSRDVLEMLDLCRGQLDEP